MGVNSTEISSKPDNTTEISSKPDEVGRGGGGKSIDNTTEISSKPDEVGRGGGGKSIGIIVGSAIGGLAAIGGLISILIFSWRRNKRNKEEDVESDDSMDHEFEQGIGPKRFSYQQLVQATNNFAEEGKLGQGGFGGVYRGYLSNLSVAVKRGEFLLIYEFMPNGSLDSHLFKSENMLSWTVRYKIAIGLASALLYLHEEWEQCVVHRDIKSSNVTLDSNFNTKLGDFGLARLMDNELCLNTTGLAGTIGYMAPEYISSGKASKGSDVFSFGVVALEIACGRRSQISLVGWAREAYGNGRVLDVADGRLGMDFNVEQMECLLMLGCGAHPDFNLRPSIRQALQVLNFEAALPNLPARMPVPMYDVPASSTEPLLSTSLLTGR
ncbi:hypothetical protein GH714_028981 [Hevea brasiliensis]|uniref:Protein kinase domain-containing protein n=1 Tax=Hevea brasiliensis TaxID=3981 RepID=A0A6A6N5A7_HEVBR|nr:hypothetical protein GH714_028981 [Hevea brasiliensis]